MYEWVGDEIEQSGVTGLKQLSYYLLQHDGLSPVSVVENVHEDGVPLTMLMPLSQPMSIIDLSWLVTITSRILALSEGDCVAFNGLHG